MNKKILYMFLSFAILPMANVSSAQGLSNLSIDALIEKQEKLSGQLKLIDNNMVKNNQILLKEEQIKKEINNLFVTIEEFKAFGVRKNQLKDLEDQKSKLENEHKTVSLLKKQHIEENEKLSKNLKLLEENNVAIQKAIALKFEDKKDTNTSTGNFGYSRYNIKT